MLQTMFAVAQPALDAVWGLLKALGFGGAEALGDFCGKHCTADAVFGVDAVGDQQCFVLGGCNTLLDRALEFRSHASALVGALPSEAEGWRCVGVRCAAPDLPGSTVMLALSGGGQGIEAVVSFCGEERTVRSFTLRRAVASEDTSSPPMLAAPSPREEPPPLPLPPADGTGFAENYTSSPLATENPTASPVTDTTRCSRIFEHCFQAMGAGRVAQWAQEYLCEDFTHIMHHPETGTHLHL
eukprot:Hpha_TRINITY_DN11642_c0_g1::TRINITY_DN11642_c0_g1_i1::g.49342::m.49342